MRAALAALAVIAGCVAPVAEPPRAPDRLFDLDVHEVPIASLAEWIGRQAKRNILVDPGPRARFRAIDPWSPPRMTRLASPLALAVLAIAPALAQDEPPADLLEHVKVGQRWVFSTSAGAEGSVEETLHVLEVVPAEGRVVYLTSSKVTLSGVSTTTGPGDASEWTWGGRPGNAGAGLPNVSSERRKLEVPGAKLEAFVWKQGTAPDILENLTAVKGELETFPGNVGAGLAGQLSRRLVRVEQGPPPAAPPTPAQLVAHVRAGQRWTFKVTIGEVTGTMVRTITAVDPESGTVVYDERTALQGMEPEVNEGASWSTGELVPALEGPTAKTTHQRHEAPGMRLDCRVVTQGAGAEALTTWIAAKDGRTMFPGPVKVVTGTTTMTELVKVE